MTSRGLGKNLNALLGNAKLITKPNSQTERESLTHLSLNQLQPGKYQPRQDMDDAALKQLADSIKQQGIIQPLTARPLSDSQYEIIAGERRWRASKLAGLKQIPVIIRDIDDESAMAVALIENIQREDLNPMDEARALQRLSDEFQLTHQQIADLVSKSRAAVSNLLRLMNLSDSVKRLLEHGDLEMGHARALLALSPAQQNHAAQLIITRNLTVREAEAFVTKIKLGKPQTEPAQTTRLPDAFNQRISRIARQLQYKVDVKHGAKGKGKLVIHYEDADRLRQLLQKLDKE